MSGDDPDKTRADEERRQKPKRDVDLATAETLEDDAATRAARRRGAGSLPSFGAMSVLGDVAREHEHVSGIQLGDAAETGGGRRSAPPRPGDSKFDVERLLGQGGMGSVYLVRDKDLRRTVALKTAQRGDDEHLARFIEEAQVMGQLQHPGIVPVHELGLTKDGRPFYTMPVVRGRTVREILDELIAGRAETVAEWSLTRLMQMFLQVCQAVAYAHSRGVIHRDIKPTNVMVGGHGEVQLLDWGLAKVVQLGGVETDLAGREDEDAILGSPAYMAPEQALGADVDARADVYALGGLLFELLTRRVVFPSNDMDSLLDSLRSEPPPRPRQIDDTVPQVLEDACLKALAKNPEERLQTADEMARAVQGWLESQADRARRRQLADERAAEGRSLFEDYLHGKDELAEIGARIETARATVRSWDPLEAKSELHSAKDAEREARRRLAETASELVARLSEALGFDAEHAQARSCLADYYWDRLQQAELRGDEDEVSFHARLLAEFHDGRYSRQLAGTGSLELESDPPGAEVWLHALEERGLVLVEGEAELLGHTPLAPTELPMGSYLVVLRKEGCRDTRYPVFISRNREWSGAVRLLTEEQIGRGWIYVPAGPAIVGGDPQCRGADLPRSEPEVEGFLVQEHPLAAEDYLEFVNAVLQERGEDAAYAVAPRGSSVNPCKTSLVELEGGRFRFDEGEHEGDQRRLILQPRHPILMVSALNAEAYCDWRSRRDGIAVRLPRELEYEKAIRGVDGRWFPWGRHFDATLCNMMQTLEGDSRLVDLDDYADAFPQDKSIYGLRCAAGNMRQWTRTEAENDEPAFAIRGGAWAGDASSCRCAMRLRPAATLVNGHVGFRLARSLPD